MRHVIAALSLLLLAGAPQDQAKKDLQRLQGTWIMVALEVDGKLVGEDKLKDTTLVIKGNKYITRVREREIETTFTLDPSKKPKAIDMVFADGDKKDKVLKGIYEIDGDTLRICRGLSPEGDRPAQFGTWPDTGIFVVTWKRQK